MLTLQKGWALALLLVAALCACLSPAFAQQSLPPLRWESAVPTAPLIPFYPTVIQHVKFILPDSLAQNGQNTAYGCFGCAVTPAEPKGTYFLMPHVDAQTFRVEALQGGKPVAAAVQAITPLPNPQFAWWVNNQPLKGPKQVLRRGDSLQLWHLMDAAFLKQAPYDGRFSLKLALYKGSQWGDTSAVTTGATTAWQYNNNPIAYFDALPVSGKTAKMPLDGYWDQLVGEKSLVIKVVSAYRITGANLPIDILANLPSQFTTLQLPVKIKAK